MIRRVTDPTDDVLEAVVELYEASFPPELKEPPTMFANALRRDDAAEVPVLLVAEPFAGFTFGVAYPAARMGFGVYIAVDPAQRHRGLGRSLALALFDALADSCPAGMDGVALEVERTEDAKTDEEREECRERLAFFGRLGAQLVTDAYVQPPLQPGFPSARLNLLWVPREGIHPCGREIVERFYRAAWKGEAPAEVLAAIPSPFSRDEMGRLKVPP